MSSMINEHTPWSECPHVVLKNDLWTVRNSLLPVHIVIDNHKTGLTAEQVASLFPFASKEIVGEIIAFYCRHNLKMKDQTYDS